MGSDRHVVGSDANRGLSIGPLVFPAVMAFGIAGILADRRRERTVRAHVVLAALCAVGNLLLLVALAVLSNLSR